MTDHYREAEKLLRDPHLDENGAAVAQVHATLASLGRASEQDAMRERDCWMERAQIAERNEGAYGADAARLRERAEKAEADRDDWKGRAARIDDDRAEWKQRAEKADAERDEALREAEEAHASAHALEDDLDVWKLRATRVKEKLDAAEAELAERVGKPCAGCVEWKGRAESLERALDGTRTRAEMAERFESRLIAQRDECEQRADDVEQQRGTLQKRFEQLESFAAMITDQRDHWKQRAEKAEADAQNWWSNAEQAGDAAIKAEEMNEHLARDLRHRRQEYDALDQAYDELVKEKKQVDRHRDTLQKRFDRLEGFHAVITDHRDQLKQRAEAAREQADHYYARLHALECDHGYRLTDSCPGCAADEDEDANEGRRPECRECTPGVGCAEACWKPDHPTPAKTESQLGNDTDHEQDVATALHAADGGEAGHWPTVAAVLAYEVRRLHAKGGSTDA